MKKTGGDRGFGVFGGFWGFWGFGGEGLFWGCGGEGGVVGESRNWVCGGGGGGGWGHRRLSPLLYVERIGVSPSKCTTHEVLFDAVTGVSVTVEPFFNKQLFITFTWHGLGEASSWF